MNKSKNINGNTLLAFILILAFAVKLIYGIVVYDSELVIDEKDYFQYAELILEDGPFVLDNDKLEAFAPPGFPWILAICIYLFGSVHSLVFINALFSVLTLYIIYLISKRFLNGNWVYVPLLWATFFVPYYLYIGKVLKEPLLQLLVPLSTYFFIRLKERHSILDVTLFSFIFTYTFHTDERYFVFLPIFMLLLLLPLRNLKKTIPITIFTFISILIFSLPWAIRNYQVYERPILITERFQSPIDSKLGINTDILERQKKFQYEREMYLDSLIAGEDPIADMGRKRSMKKAVEEGLMPHDYSWYEKVYYNTLGYWSPVRTKGIMLGSGWKYKGSRSFLVNIMYTLNFGILIPFMLLGIFKLIKNGNWSQLVLPLLLFTHYIVHVFLIFPSGRYRHPVDFIIIILAAIGLYLAMQKIKKLRKV